MAGGSEPEQELEAQQLKALAEAQFKKSKLKSALKYANRAHRLCPSLDGLSDTITSFRILHVAAKSPAGSTPDWYDILQVKPCSHINTIKTQYKKLALVFDPDKNSSLGSEDAFKLVSEAFEVLSNRSMKKEYDAELRLRLGTEAGDELPAAETFWTACSRCSLLQQLERRFLGQILVCPSCKRKFQAVESERDGEESEARVSSGSEGSVDKLENMGSDDDDDDDDDDDKLANFLGLKGKIGNGALCGNKLRNVRSGKEINGQTSVEELGNVGSVDAGDADVDDDDKIVNFLRLKGKIGNDALCGNRLRTVRSAEDVDGHINNGEHGNLRKEASGGEWSDGRLRKRTISAGDLPKRSAVKRVKIGEEMMTLAEIQLEAKRKALSEKEKEKLKVKDKAKEKGRTGASEKSRSPSIETGEALQKCRSSGNKGPAGSSYRDNIKIEGSNDVDGIMTVEDSDFYDFDKDRVEKSFKQGQVWAVYDDDDGMPRLYGLIDEVISLYPFKVKMSWLDLRNNGDNDVICMENTRLHKSCGDYKVSRKTSIDTVNIFSHTMACERAAKEVYRIYPTKGSVWALYTDGDVDGDERHYEIAVFLTSYNENYGLSMAYLEKVEGLKTVFRRREIGCHGIRWFESDDVRLFSHEIPARKLCGEEVADDLKDCWELDPASLPSYMLTANR